MNLLSYESWKATEELKESNEQINNDFEERIFESIVEGYLINESIKSTILKDILNSDPRANNRYAGKLASELYKSFGFALDQLSDEDFQRITPDQAFERPYKGDANKLIFLLNDDTRLADEWTDWKKKNHSIPVLMAILRGGTALWYGFNSKASYRQGTKDKYGIMHDDYQKSEYFGRNTKITLANKNYVDYSTIGYVLDLEAAKEKYSTATKKSERAEAKKGAIALMDAKQIKAMNEAKYKELLAKGLTPEKIFEDFKRIWEKASIGIQDVVAKMNLSDLNTYEKVRQFDVKFDGWWSANPGDILGTIYKQFGKYLDNYRQYAEWVREVEKAEDNSTLAGVSKEGYVRYYQEKLDSAALHFVQDKQAFKKIENDLDKALAQLKSIVK